MMFPNNCSIIYRNLKPYHRHPSCSYSVLWRNWYLLGLPSDQHYGTIIMRCYCYFYGHHHHLHHIPSFVCSNFNDIYKSQPFEITCTRSFDVRREQPSETRSDKMAKLLSGKEVSEEIRLKLKEKVKELSLKPILAIIQVGGREDSNVYIRMKKNYVESIGGGAKHVQLPRTITQDELALQVETLNKDPEVHGVIVQLPFDCVERIDAHYITNLISPNKDVDGLTVINAGNLLHGQISGHDSFIPCTPFGCLELIKKSNVKIEGSNAVVLGRSKIVGSPMAQLLIWNNATVTVCHSKTKNLPEVVKTGDILVVAIGKPLFVKKEWIKPGAVVIDCGISSIPDASKKSGQRLVGDVDFDGAKEVASYITPVPGGVGPMTVAMLINNTVESAIRCQAKNKNGNV